MRRKDPSGFTLIELLLVVAIIAILAGLSAPYLLSARAASNEASAIGSLRSLNGAEGSFATVCGGNFYSTSVPQLVNGRYISPDMVLNPKSGYAMLLAAGAGAAPGPADCTNNIPSSAYYASATPLAQTTGRRAFATNQQATIWQSLNPVPPAEPFQVAAGTSPIQ
jgi:prepilin-type N-terminal cleavage/methylation domain-containing protein